MPYGKVNKLLNRIDEFYDANDDTVIIESPFIETSRLGTRIRSVFLAMTTKALIIARKITNYSKVNNYSPLLEDNLEVFSVHDLNKVKLTIFKRSKRQVLKVSCCNRAIRYYELGICKKRRIFWELWCNHVNELNKLIRMWPFTSTICIRCIPYCEINSKVFMPNETPIHIPIKKEGTQRWVDKYLYLGTKREFEDKIMQPRPVPGLGNTEDLKLLYLKPQYFGCWDQSDHWMQCEHSPSDAFYDYNVCTYTGEPTSNVTYTSIMTTEITLHFYVLVEVNPVW